MPSSANSVPRAALKRSCGLHVWDYSSSDLAVFPGLVLPAWAMCVVYDEDMFNCSERIVRISRGAYTMTAVLQQISDALTTTVATVSPGIVRVEARRRLPASGLVWSRDGIIVTTHHVIEQDDNIRVGLHRGQTLAATLVGRDATTDLAVLRAASADLEPPAWAEAEILSVGHLVLALGRPGQRVQATLGIASALGESWRTPAGGLIDRYVQTDIVMYPG